jgi:alcohol dehydrogenase class IV
VSHHLQHQTLGQVLNYGIAFWYVVAAIGFATVLIAVGRTRESFYTNLMLAACALGTFMFLAGCGLHHADIAQNINEHAQHALTNTQLVFQTIQFVGAPIAVICGYLFIRQVQLYENGHMRRRGDVLTGSEPTVEATSESNRRLTIVLFMVTTTMIAFLGWQVQDTSKKSANDLVNHAVVKSQLEGCNIGAGIYARYINQIRAQSLGDKAVASDPRQPRRTRVARLKQAGVEDANVGYFLTILDSRHAHLLTDQKDRSFVAHNSVSCNKIFKVVK